MINKRLYGLFCCLHRQMSRNSHKLFKENNLSHVQMYAMIFVECESKEGRRVCQKDIEKHINLRPSATSSMLANLEKKGFITRTVRRRCESKIRYAYRKGYGCLPEKQTVYG